MKKTTLLIVLNLALGLAHCVHGQGTAFTYQGKLTHNGSPANGNYDFNFRIYDAPVAGKQLPMTPMTVSKAAVQVANGVFTVNLDFGAAMFTGGGRWLEVDTRPSGMTVAAEVLTPRTELTPTPYAIYAETASTLTGPIAESQLPASVAKLNANETFTGTAKFAPASGAPFTVGNSTKVNNLNADLLDNLDSTAFWKTRGNGGTSTADFIGTTDSNPVEFRVNGQRALKLQTGNNFVAGDNPLVVVGVSGSAIGGGKGNTIETNYSTISGGKENIIGTPGIFADGSTDVSGAVTIGGGYRNAISVDSKHAVIGGGSRNRIGASYASVGGGANNSVTAESATIAGGTNNAVHGSWGTVAGGYNNVVDGFYGTIPGGYDNYIGSITAGAMAAGHRARALHSGAFVWADNRNEDFSSTGLNQFCIRARGGVQLDPYTSISFGSNTRQMLNLWGQEYGIGVQGWTEYFRSAYGFSWFKGGTHSNDPNNAGGGAELMRLTPDGLTVYGKTTTKTLTITGGADLAEPFQISGDKVPKGALVIIDEQNAGHLKLSARAYDSRVAGIVSGANGINPGVMMHQEGALEGGQNVALSGRVYALADASQAAIKPGDLLTTSDTPGHCMKAADREKAQGAIIGKAMTGLGEGKGMVLVLVSLQ